MTTPQELAEAAIKAAEANAEKNIARAEGREPKPDAAEAAQLAELEAEAEKHGVTVEQLRGAHLSGMTPEDYAAWDRGAVAIGDIEEIEAERRARREAEHRRLVEKIKAKLP